MGPECGVGEHRLQSIVSKVAITLACVIAVNGAADAQNTPASPALPPAFSAPQVAPPQPLSSADAELLRAGMAAARAGDIAGAQSARTSLTDPLARKLVQWTIIDSDAEQIPFFELDQARRDLWGWPKSTTRQIAAERRLGSSGLAPPQVLGWFEASPAHSAEGAMALASAYLAIGKEAEAKALIRRTWRDSLFEADVQRTFLGRFGSDLTTEDHIRRLDSLLYGPHGPAAQEMLEYVPADYRTLGQARIALRAGAANAGQIAAAVPGALARDPGLAFERARYLRARGMEAAALSLIGDFPSAPPHAEGVKLVWKERWALFNAGMRARNYRAAYGALQNHGLEPGSDLADAEFFAGWLALKRLGDPTLADAHFLKLQNAGSSPITLGRAYYWRGRAHEEKGDSEGAQRLYADGGRFYTSFYGQLAAEKAGVTRISLGKEPVPTPADRARFEGREQVRAARMLAESGQKDLFRTFVLFIDDALPNAEEAALLVDLARGYGDQDLAMRVVRTSAQRGFVLPERGYPLRSTPSTNAAEPALVLGIVRQESGFDPRVRSGVGARGMMQLMPATARIVAGQNGLSYSAEMLDDPDYNMRLGTSYIGQMVDRFSGSYLLAAAAYNAGPGRPDQWVGACGDPRASSADPTDFIECIPFSETRNYVMRVLEGMQVYRARLNGGQAPLTLSSDLKRGGYAYGGGFRTVTVN
jgi:soluble lytic murein transglycosylase